MLAGMSRFVLLALLMGGSVVSLAACGNGSKSAGEQQKSPPSGSDEKIAVPGVKGGTEGSTEGAGVRGGSAGTPATGSTDVLTDAGYQKVVANAQFHLKPEEGTLTAAKAEGKAGAATSAEIKLAPGAGFHVATDYPIKLKLMETPGVKLEKQLLTAGGRDKKQGDAATLSEQALAFAVKVTPEAAGAYEIKGTFSFGVCEQDSCHPRTQPITIQVAAN
jgi:hypothetical protein